MYRTNKDIVTAAYRFKGESTWTLPVGSRATLVKGLSGIAGDGFTAANVAQLKDLSGNSHDPVYRYLIIAAVDVDGETDSERLTVARIRNNESRK